MPLKVLQHARNNAMCTYSQMQHTDTHTHTPSIKTSELLKKRGRQIKKNRKRRRRRQKTRITNLLESKHISNDRTPL